MKLNIPLGVTGYQLFLNAKYGKGTRMAKTLNQQAVADILAALVRESWNVLEVNTRAWDSSVAITASVDYPIIEHVGDNEHYKASTVEILVRVSDRELVVPQEDDDD